MFYIEIIPEALTELKDIPAFYRKIIEEEIERKLLINPTKLSKNIKCLEPMILGFEHEEPLWELRVNEYRVFYDVNSLTKTVVIRAVKHKGTKTTGEII